MDLRKIHLYLVYESIFYYKNKDKFHELGLTNDTIQIKEKYIEKDGYSFDFIEIPQEYSAKILHCIQEKFVKSSFPFAMKKGELQKECQKIIQKFAQLQKEKSKQHSLENTTPMVYKLIALIANKNTMVSSINNSQNVIDNNIFLFAEYTVVYNPLSSNPEDFLCSITHPPLSDSVHVCHHSKLPEKEVNAICTAFFQDFAHCKSLSGDLGLVWFQTTEQEVMQWLKNIKEHKNEVIAPPNLLLEFPGKNCIMSDVFLNDSVIVHDHIPVIQEKKTRRKKAKKN